ncbi:MAG: hypothetical protein EZS28_000452 [Streblomastix strix]|uniref:Uncharacterized protein n=1 Tax=Streblomastix strix TaxID=222440 RepID=A0A5J4X9P6_9EUKA|nr:MAG: hypothetical protein EZS28_000452 [Streblomastix strix]
MVNVLLVRVVLTLFVKFLIVPYFDWDSSSKQWLLLEINIGIQLIILGLYLFINNLIKKRQYSDEKTVKVIEIKWQDALNGNPVETTSLQSIPEYDTSEVFGSLKGMLVSSVLTAFFFFIMHSIQQVIVQILLSPIQFVFNPLVQIYLFKREIDRPYSEGILLKFKNLMQKASGQVSKKEVVEASSVQKNE